MSESVASYTPSTWALAPLLLDPATVANAGVLRAAFDAVKASPDVLADYQRATALGLGALDKHRAACADLARRSASAHRMAH